MPIPDVCAAQGDSLAGGGYAGGGGAGQASASAPGGSASGGGWPMIDVVTGMRKTLTIQLRGRLDGVEAADLTGVDRVLFRAKETQDGTTLYIDTTATVVDATAGTVSLELTPEQLLYPGIWPAAFVCETDREVLGSDPVPEITSEFRAWLCVRRGIGYTRTDAVPLSIPELRMSIRDVAADYNMLLNDLEFSDNEIAYAITRVIDDWNESTPQIRLFTQATFPWREAWTKAACAYLMRAAAHHYARNELQYQGGGMTVNDKSKAAPYLQLATMLMQEWREFRDNKKAEINIAQFSGSLGSGVYGGITGGW